MAERDWAEVSNEFRWACIRALEDGMTPAELQDDLDSVIEEEGE